MNILLKMKYSFYSMLVFFLISNPETYKTVQSLVGGWFTVATAGGCPTPFGLFLHTCLFFLVMLALMMFPRD